MQLVMVLKTSHCAQGNQVAYLIGTNAVPTSNFTYWVSPPPPPLPPGTEPPPASGPPTIIRVGTLPVHIAQAAVLCHSTSKGNKVTGTTGEVGVTRR